MSGAPALGGAVAGSWYPASRDALATLVDRLLGEARDRQSRHPRTPVALIAPHAGFLYSGAVAASAFACVGALAPDRILLVGPSHYHDFDGAVVPREADAYATPLGPIPIDRDVTERLSRAGLFRADDRPFGPEHALEAELPFLQRSCASSTPVVPVLVGPRTSSDGTRAIAEALGRELTSRSLVVVSSDFTHYGERFGYTPFRDDVPARIRRLDLDAIRRIEEGDADGFARLVDEAQATICGHRAIEAMLRLPGMQAGARLVEYDTSGRMTGSFDSSVSYASLSLEGAA